MHESGDMEDLQASIDSATSPLRYASHQVSVESAGSPEFSAVVP